MELNSQLDGKEKINSKDLGISETQKAQGKIKEDTAPKAPPKSQKKINFKEVFNWVIFLLVFLGIAYLGYMVYNAYTYQPTSNVTELKLIEDEDVIKRIDGSVDQGESVKTSESGYGRADPFERY